MESQIIEKMLPGFLGEAWLIKLREKYYVVSGVSAMFSGWEVLVFSADEHGEVTSWDRGRRIVTGKPEIGRAHV